MHLTLALAWSARSAWSICPHIEDSETNALETDYQYCARRSFLEILPVAVFGSSETKCTLRGSL